MTRLLVAVAAAPLVLAGPGGLPAATDAGDQAAAEAAVAVFDDRLTAAGWTSVGQFTQSAPEGDEETEFGGCLNGFERYLDYTDVHFEGETARAFSANFELAGSSPSSTDAVDDFGYAGAVVLVADESGQGLLDTFVAQLGDPGTVACMMKQPMFEEITDVAITNEADLGVGDASARLDLTLSVSYDGAEFVNAATFAAARVDRSLAVVVAGGSSARVATLDTVAELAAMADTLDG